MGMSKPLVVHPACITPAVILTPIVHGGGCTVTTATYNTVVKTNNESFSIYFIR